MKILKIPERQFKEMLRLYDDFYEIYGNEKTVWSLDDLDEMRKIGQEFMDIFAINFKE